MTVDAGSWRKLDAHLEMPHEHLGAHLFLSSRVLSSFVSLERLPARCKPRYRRSVAVGETHVSRSAREVSDRTVCSSPPALSIGTLTSVPALESREARHCRWRRLFFRHICWCRGPRARLGLFVDPKATHDLPVGSRRTDPE